MFYPFYRREKWGTGSLMTFSRLYSISVAVPGLHGCIGSVNENKLPNYYFNCILKNICRRAFHSFFIKTQTVAIEGKKTISTDKWEKPNLLFRRKLRFADEDNKVFFWDFSEDLKKTFKEANDPVKSLWEAKFHN